MNLRRSGNIGIYVMLGGLILWMASVFTPENNSPAPLAFLNASAFFDAASQPEATPSKDPTDLTDKYLVWDIDPVLFNLGPLEIRYYGILFGLGLLIAFLLFKQMVRNDIPEFAPEQILIVAAVSLVIGAHLFHVVFYEWDNLLKNPERLFQVGKGLASHGGVVFLLLGLFIYCYWRKISFLKVMDAMAIVSGITGLCIRTGNFFNSEIIGRETDVPWAVIFARVDDEPRHPSMLYEGIMCIFYFAVLYPLYWRLKPKVHPGFFLGLVLAFYFTMRIVLEFTREFQSELIDKDQATITMGTWLSIPILIGATALFLWAAFTKPPPEKKKGKLKKSK